MIPGFAVCLSSCPAACGDGNLCGHASIAAAVVCSAVEIERGRPPHRVGQVRAIPAALVALAVCLANGVGVAADSTCPDRVAIGQAIQVLVGQPLIEPDRTSAEIEIRDEGDRYSVSVRGRHRDFEDRERDCGRRARQAAVFVALTLSPPDFGVPATDAESSVPPPDESTPPSPLSQSGSGEQRAEPPPRSPTVHQAPSPVEQHRHEVGNRADARYSRFGVEAGALCAIPAAAHTPWVSVGPELTLRWSIDPRLALSVQGSLPTRTTLLLDELRVRQSRIPLSMMVTYGFRGEVGRIGVSVGPVVVPTHLDDSSLVAHHGATRVEGGARLASTVVLGTGRFAPLLRAFVDWLPLRPQIAVEPKGPVGRTPGFWCGVVAGLDWETN